MLALYQMKLAGEVSGIYVLKIASTSTFNLSVARKEVIHSILHEILLCDLDCLWDF